MTRLWLVFRLSVIGVFTNKVRSALTMLGIIIGIASVIAMLSLGTGAQQDILDGISTLGTNVISIIPGGDSLRGGPIDEVNNAYLTERDFKYLNNPQRFPYVQAISPVISSSFPAVYKSNSLQVSLQGVGSEYQQIQSLSVVAGRFLQDNDSAGSKHVVVVGPTIVSELFPGVEAQDVLNESIFIEGKRFMIVGILKERGSSGFSDSDTEVFIPYTTAQEKIFGSDIFSMIQISVESTELLPVVVDRIEEKLGEFRHNETEELDFTIFTSDEILKTVTQVTNIFKVLLASIAAISLLVGGIGISNIMLVSVTERTKEIGLRKAIGAKERDILLQFLLESIILTVVGGIIGIVMGITIALVVSRFTDISVIVTISNVLLATIVAALVGITFGFAPAYKASKLSPIDAIRYE